MNRKLTFAGSALLAIAGMVAAFELGRRGSANPSSKSDPEVSIEERWTPQTGESTAGPSPSTGYRPLETLVVDPTHSTVKFVSSESRSGERSMVLVGAPGIWPPATLTTDQHGVLYLPQTDIRTLTGDRFRQYELLARSTSQPRAFWGVVDFGRRREGEEGSRRRLELSRAAAVGVQVVGPEGEPRDGAEVRLSRGTVGFVTLNKQTGPGGGASFRAIPPGEYSAAASLVEVGGGVVRFEHGGGERTTVEIELIPSRAPQLPVEPEADAGPTNVEVRLHGLREAEWRQAALKWRRPGGEWRHGTLHPVDERGVRSWRKRVPSTPVELRLETRDGASDSRTIGTAAAEAPVHWQLDLKATHAIYVADAYGAPVGGALIQVWREGRRVESVRSREAQSVALRLERGVTYRIVAIDSRRGEAVREVTAGEAPEELTMRVDRPLFSSQFPVERPQAPSRAESILGVSIVRDGDAWVIDAEDPDSRAARSGLKRGDRLMSLQRGDGRWRVIVEREDRIVERELVPK